VLVERRPVHRGIALSACPGGVSAAVPEAGLMTYQHLARAEGVAVEASRRGWGDPLPSGIWDEASASTCRLDGSPPLLADRRPDCGE